MSILLTGCLALALLPACARPPAGPSRPHQRVIVLRESAPRERIALALEMVNPTPWPVQVFALPACRLLLRVYALAGPSRPVWDQGRRPEACPGAEGVRLLPPGGSLRVVGPWLDAAGILGDSLAVGRYRVTAYLPAAPGAPDPSGGVELAAGAVVLAR